jgi:hypothetical protein
MVQSARPHAAEASPTVGPAPIGRVHRRRSADVLESCVAGNASPPGGAVLDLRAPSPGSNTHPSGRRGVDRARSRRRDVGGTLAHRHPTSTLRPFEGTQVNILFRDGSRIDDCNLVSSGRNRLDNLWLFISGEDVFVPRADLVDIWQADSHRPRAA